MFLREHVFRRKKAIFDILVEAEYIFFDDATIWEIFGFMFHEDYAEDNQIDFFKKLRS